MSGTNPDQALLNLAADVVSAYASHHRASIEELPDVIHAVYHALSTAGTAPVVEAPREPAVPVRKSVYAAYIVCLEDGRQLKMLKRHLHTAYGLTPEAYRTRWGLPPSYPMVAPNYASHRSIVAKSLGLGRKAALSTAAEVAVQRIPAGVGGKKLGRPKRVATVVTATEASE